jgi:hypothetical protein
MPDVTTCGTPLAVARAVTPRPVHDRRHAGARPRPPLLAVDSRCSVAPVVVTSIALADE